MNAENSTVAVQALHVAEGSEDEVTHFRRRDASASDPHTCFTSPGDVNSLERVPFFAISPAIPASVAASQHSVQPRQVSLHRQPASLNFQPPLPHRSSSHRRALLIHRAPLRSPGGAWGSLALAC